MEAHARPCVSIALLRLSRCDVLPHIPCCCQCVSMCFYVALLGGIYAMPFYAFLCVSTVLSSCFYVFLCGLPFVST